MSVSVIIPAYNAERHVAAAVQSALQQSVPCHEVIVVDDCSRDATATITAALAQADRRIRLLSLPSNGGPGVARNAGFAAATGAWVALLDADDSYRPQRLERLLELAARSGADIVSDNLMQSHEDGSQPDAAMFTADRLGSEQQLTATGFVLENANNAVGVRTSFGFMKPMFNREFLRSAGVSYHPSSRFGEDFMFYTDCLARGAKWWVTPEPLYLYNVRGDSLTSSVALEDLRAISVMDQALLDRPDSAAIPGFVTAIQKHKRMIDHWRYTQAFDTALKHKGLREAFGVAFESRSSGKAVLKEMVRSAVFKVSRTKTAARA